MDGHLDKKGDKGLIKLFRRRLFQLRGPYLFYSQPGKNHIIGVIDMRRSYSLGLLKGEDRVFQFRVVKRYWILRADTPEIASKWIEMLKESQNCPSYEDLPFLSRKHEFQVMMGGDWKTIPVQVDSGMFFLGKIGSEEKYCLKDCSVVSNSTQNLLVIQWTTARKLFVIQGTQADITALQATLTTHSQALIEAYETTSREKSSFVTIPL
jgi:hypothetical protein